MTKMTMKSMSSDEVETVRFQVFGQVQGVGFRWWTRSRARDLGVAGTAKNLEDGSVEVIATGTHGLLDALERELRSGPPLARVERVSRTNAESSELEGFEIIH